MSDTVPVSPLSLSPQSAEPQSVSNAQGRGGDREGQGALTTSLCYTLLIQRVVKSILVCPDSSPLFHLLLLLLSPFPDMF